MYVEESNSNLYELRKISKTQTKSLVEELDILLGTRKVIPEAEK